MLFYLIIMLNSKWQSCLCMYLYDTFEIIEENLRQCRCISTFFSHTLSNPGEIINNIPNFPFQSSFYLPLQVVGHLLAVAVLAFWSLCACNPLWCERDETKWAKHGKTWIWLLCAMLKCINTKQKLCFNKFVFLNWHFFSLFAVVFPLYLSKNKTQKEK